MKDITGLADVKILVDSFYTKVRADELLAPVFASRIPVDAWGPHLERMYSFWNTVLFLERTYKGNPFAKHATLPIDGPHFEHWLSLFTKTVDEHFSGEKADEAKQRASSMAMIFTAKLKHLRAHPNYRNLV
jgi:hemoglobin